MIKKKKRYLVAVAEVGDDADAAVIEAGAEASAVFTHVVWFR